jgi:hypothetical protein
LNSADKFRPGVLHETKAASSAIPPTAAALPDAEASSAQVDLLKLLNFVFIIQAFILTIAEKAKPVQVIMEAFFKTRNPCKHWSKSVPGGPLSSMFITFYVIYHVLRGILDKTSKKTGF